VIERLVVPSLIGSVLEKLFPFKETEGKKSLD